MSSSPGVSAGLLLQENAGQLTCRYCCSLVITQEKEDLLTHLVLSVVGGATAVLTFGLVLVSVDHLTQLTEVADHWPHKLCSCRRRTEWLEVTGGQWSNSHFLSPGQHIFSQGENWNNHGTNS